MSSMFDAIKSHRYLLFTILLFITFVLITGLKGNYPTNDDWYFVRQVKAFNLGIFTLHAKVLPILLAQGFLGLFWGKLFSIDFQSLRVLTVIITVIACIFLYKTVLLLNPNRVWATLGVIVFLFNPLVLSSSFTFMTENYYLLFMIMSLYYSMSFFENSRASHYYLALISILLAALTRQTGIYLVFVLFITLVISRKQLFSAKKASVLFFIAVIGLLTIALWPRFHTDVIEKTINLSDGFKDIIQRFLSMFLILPALVFWISPMVNLPKMTKKAVLSAIPFIFILSYVLFFFDIFPMGSVFYFEGLHIKSGFRHSLSVFDNVPAKIVMSVYVSIFLLSALAFLYRWVRKLQFKDSTLLLLGLGLLGTVATNMVTPALYDRYFLPAFVYLILMIAYYSKSIVIKPQNWIALFVLLFISVSQVYELVTVRNLKHSVFVRMVENNPLNATERDIYVDDTYSKYLYAEENQDYEGKLSSLPVGLTHNCYVQQYTQDSQFSTSLKKIEKKIEKRIENPSVYGATPPIRNIRITKHLDELIYNEMYFSPLYSIIGKKAYVGSWCDK